MLARLVSNSWPRVICLLQPTKVLGLQVWATALIPMFNLLRNYQAVFQGDCTSLHPHQEFTRLPVSPHSCQFLLLSILFIVAIPVLICISLMDNDVEHLFMCLLGQCILFFFSLSLSFLKNFVFFCDRVLLCYPGWSAVVQSWLTALSISQAICPPQLPK